MPRLAQVYTGEFAKNYDQDRETKKNWQIEQRTVEAELAAIRPGERVLDIAAGTGRWLTTYKLQGARVTLADISADMLALAHQKAEELDFPATLLEMDALGAPAYPPTDWLVCTRFFVWISMADIERVLAKAKAAGARKFVVLVHYLEDNQSPINMARAYARYFVRGIRTRLGLTTRAKTFIHRETALRGVIAGCGLTIERETVIDRRYDRTYAIFTLTTA